MNRTKFIQIFFALVVFLLFFHLLAKTFYLYWMVWWFDIPVHILGGFISALLIVFFFLFFNSNFFKSKLFFAVFPVAFSVIIGVLWEIYESKTGITPGSSNLFLSTLSDFLMDIVGGFLAVGLFYFPFKKKI